MNYRSFIFSISVFGLSIFFGQPDGKVRNTDFLQNDNVICYSESNNKIELSKQDASPSHQSYSIKRP